MLWRLLLFADLVGLKASDDRLFSFFFSVSSCFVGREERLGCFVFLLCD